VNEQSTLTWVFSVQSLFYLIILKFCILIILNVHNMLFKQKTYKNQNLSKNAKSILSTHNKINIVFDWCRTTCLSVLNHFIEDDHVATWNGRTVLSDLGNTCGCKGNAGRCSSPDRTIIWASQQVNNICPFTAKGNYSAHFSNPFFVVDRLHAAFSIKTGGFKLCPELAPIHNTFQCVMIKFIVYGNTSKTIKKYIIRLKITTP